MTVRLEIIAVEGIGDITPGTDLAAAITGAAPWLRSGDVLVVTSKIVSKAEGQLVDVPLGGPEREVARTEILAAETARPVARRGHTRIVQTHHGFVMASAGIDASNVDRSQLVLLPKDPDASARELRAALLERHGLDVAIIVSDTMGRPWRNGLTDVALGAAGIAPVRDHRGETDPYGNQLQITQMAIIDELSAAAELVKGKCDQVPVAVVRGYLGEAATREDGPGATVLVRDAANDLFSLGTAEARAAGLAAAAALTDVEAFGDAPVTRESVDRAIALAAMSAATTVAVVAVEAAQPGLPPGTVFTINVGLRDDAHHPSTPDPRQLVYLGADLQRLRSALAADGLATNWLRTAPAEGSSPSGQLLAVGPPPRAS